MSFLWAAGGDRGGIWEKGKGQGRGQPRRHPGREIPCGFLSESSLEKRHGSIQQLGPAPNWELRAPARTHGNIWEFFNTSGLTHQPGGHKAGAGVTV